jgi:hypothetical protein
MQVLGRYRTTCTKQDDRVQVKWWTKPLHVSIGASTRNRRPGSFETLRSERHLRHTVQLHHITSPIHRPNPPLPHTHRNMFGGP